MWCRVPVSNGPSATLRNTVFTDLVDLILFNGPKDPSVVSTHLPRARLTLERVTDYVPAEVCKTALQLRMLLSVPRATPAPNLSWRADMGPPQAEPLGVEQELQTATATSSRGSRSLALVKDDLSGGVCIITTKAASCWLIFYFPGFTQWGLKMCR